MAKQWLENAKLRFKKRELLPLSTLGLQIRPEKPEKASLKSQKTIMRPAKANLRTDSGLRRLILCSNRVYYDLRVTSDFKSG